MKTPTDDEQVVYYLVWPDEHSTEQPPWSLFRRITRKGVVVAADAYHPDTGWHQTDYWLRTARGELDRHLVEVDAVRAEQARRAFHELLGG